jgi:molybdenum cofactor biosynthesis enzyme MoaA
LISKSINFLSSVDELRLLVSMNAGTRETYKTVHRKDHFDKVIEGIRLLQESRAGKYLYIRLKMVIMHQNRHDIPAYVGIAKDLQVDEVRFANALLYEKADMRLEDQLQAGSVEWRETEADLEWATGELAEAEILCTYAGPGWKREDTPEALDPLLLDEDFE